MWNEGIGIDYKKLGFSGRCPLGVSGMRINENIISNSMETLANGSGFVLSKGANVQSKSVDMSAEWGVQDATEYEVTGGSDTILLYKPYRGFDQGRKYTYQCLVKNSGDVPFDVDVQGLVEVDGTNLPNVPPVTIAPGEARLFSQSGFRRLSYDFIQMRLYTGTIGGQIKFVIAREMVQVGEFPSGVWTPPKGLLTVAQQATLPPYGDFKEILPL